MVQMKVFDHTEEKAKRFAELMNDMEWHTKRELLDELEISVKTLQHWLKNANIERTEGIEPVQYMKHGRLRIKPYKVIKYRTKEKIEVIVIKCKKKQSNQISYANYTNRKWENIIKEIIGDQKEIKRNDLIDIGIEINFNKSVRDMVAITENLGVRVI